MAKTKGTHVINAVKVLRQDRERARKWLPPHLHKYLEQRLLPSTWYPLEDQLVLLRCIATLFMPSGQPGPGIDPWNAMGRGTARMDLTGVYKSHLRAGDPTRTLEALAAIWRSVNDSGEVIATSDGPERFSITKRGYDVRTPEMCAMHGGYLEEAVALAGGKDPRVHHERCYCKGASECIWRVQWQKS
jgi:uncharacterized protein (TIGR02265 family)